jgi:hypothetical protein
MPDRAVRDYKRKVTIEMPWYVHLRKAMQLRTHADSVDLYKPSWAFFYVESIDMSHLHLEAHTNTVIYNIQASPKEFNNVC